MAPRRDHDRSAKGQQPRADEEGSVPSGHRNASPYRHRRSPTSDEEITSPPGGRMQRPAGRQPARARSARRHPLRSKVSRASSIAARRRRPGAEELPVHHTAVARRLGCCRSPVSQPDRQRSRPGARAIGHRSRAQRRASSMSSALRANGSARTERAPPTSPCIARVRASSEAVQVMRARSFRSRRNGSRTGPTITTCSASPRACSSVSTSGSPAASSARTCPISRDTGRPGSACSSSISPEWPARLRAAWRSRPRTAVPTPGRGERVLRDGQHVGPPRAATSRLRGRRAPAPRPTRQHVARAHVERLLEQGLRVIQPVAPVRHPPRHEERARQHTYRRPPRARSDRSNSPAATHRRRGP